MDTGSVSEMSTLRVVPSNIERSLPLTELPSPTRSVLVPPTPMSRPVMLPPSLASRRLFDAAMPTEMSPAAKLDPVPETLSVLPVSPGIKPMKVLLLLSMSSTVAPSST